MADVDAPEPSAELRAVWRWPAASPPSPWIRRRNRNALSAAVRAQLIGCAGCRSGRRRRSGSSCSPTRGPVFCSGMDLKEEARRPRPAGRSGTAGDPAADLALPEAGGGQGRRPGAGRRDRHSGGRRHRGGRADGDLRVHRGADRADPGRHHRAGAASGGAGRGPRTAADRRGLRRGAGAARSGWSTRSRTTSTAPSPAMCGLCWPVARPHWPAPRRCCRPGWTIRTSATRGCWTSRRRSSPPRRPARARGPSPRSGRRLGLTRLRVSD